MAAVDPFGPWSWKRRLVWLAITAGMVYWLGPFPFRALFLDPAAPFVDFFLDWSAGRNHQDGLSVYMSPDFSAERYLGIPRTGSAGYRVVGHPPNTILYAYPFALLSYPAAFFLWNCFSVAMLLGSLWLIARGLSIPLSSWSFLPIVTFLIACMPLMSHLIQGQWSTILLFLIVLVWRAARSGHFAVAGALLGVAVSIKLFPAFLLAQFVRWRGWHGLVSFILSLGALTWWAAEILGYESFSTYVNFIAPTAADFRFEGVNASLVGFWYRLFMRPLRGPGVENVPFADWPSFAFGATLVSIALLVVIYLFVLFRGRRGEEREREDLAFGMGVTGMLLASPITWDHYLLILVLPLAVVWTVLTRRGERGWPLGLVFVGLMFPPSLADWQWYSQVRAAGSGPPPEWILRPFESLMFYSIPTYAMLGLFGLGARLAMTQPTITTSTSAR